MGKFIKEFLWRVSFVLIGALLGPIVYVFIGQRYPEFIKNQPRGLLIIIFFSFLFILSLVGIIHRRASVRKSNLNRDVSDFEISPEGNKTFGVIKHMGVGWKTEYPKPFLSYDLFRESDTPRYLLKVDPDTIRTGYFPFCPECCTPLKERDTFFGLHLWECKKCNFKKRSIRSFYYESKRATIKAREKFKSIKDGRVSKDMVLNQEYRDLFSKPL